MIVRLICVLILVFEYMGLSTTFRERGWGSLVFYTVLSNIVAALSALLVLVFGMNSVTVFVRYFANCMLIMTFFVTALILVPYAGTPKKLMFSSHGLYLHTLVPVTSVCSYVFLEQHVKAAAAPFVSGFAIFSYGMLMLYLNYISKVDGPYPFFRVRERSAGATVLWMTVLVMVIGAISAGLYFL